MGAWRDTIAPAGGGRGTTRYFIAGALLALVLVGLVVVLVTGDGSARDSSSLAVKSPSAAAGGSGAGGSGAGGSGAAAGSSHATAAHSGAAGAARAGAPATSVTAGAKGPTSTSAVAGGADGQTTEVRDPEEANSYPAPASVQHSSASAPAAAGEEIVAPGATSTAEVRKELAQMHAVESASRKQTLTPVKGGDSIGGNGTIPIPTNVPEVVQRVIAGANAIADFPYRFGGGHGSFIDNAYDCSGSVSYALAAGGLLSAPETSGVLESWGKPGPGRYITVYANAGHTYMYVDGLLYDTAGRSGVFASRWQVYPVNNSGYVVRHWPGL